MVKKLRKILNSLIVEIEKTNDFELKKDIAHQILTKIFQTRDIWLDEDFFEREILYPKNLS